MTTDVQVKATRSDQASPSHVSPPPPPLLPLLLPVRVEFVLTVLAFKGTFVPRKSICLPESYAARCQTGKD